MRNLTTHYKAIRKPHELKRKRVVKKSTRARRTKEEIPIDEVQQSEPTHAVPDSAANNNIKPFQMRTVKTMWDM